MAKYYRKASVVYINQYHTAPTKRASNPVASNHAGSCSLGCLFGSPDFASCSDSTLERKKQFSLEKEISFPEKPAAFLKYGRDTKTREIKRIKLVVPGQAIRANPEKQELYISCLIGNDSRNGRNIGHWPGSKPRAPNCQRPVSLYLPGDMEKASIRR